MTFLSGLASDCSVLYLANGPDREVTFDAEHQLAHLIIVAAQKSVLRPFLLDADETTKGAPSTTVPVVYFGVRSDPPERPPT